MYGESHIRTLLHLYQSVLNVTVASLIPEENTDIVYKHVNIINEFIKLKGITEPITLNRNLKEIERRILDVNNFEGEYDPDNIKRNNEIFYKKFTDNAISPLFTNIMSRDINIFMDMSDITQPDCVSTLVVTSLIEYRVKCVLNTY